MPRGHEPVPVEGVHVRRRRAGRPARARNRPDVPGGRGGRDVRVNGVGQLRAAAAEVRQRHRVFTRPIAAAAAAADASQQVVHRDPAVQSLVVAAEDGDVARFDVEAGSREFRSHRVHDRVRRGGSLRQEPQTRGGPQRQRRAFPRPRRHRSHRRRDERVEQRRGGARVLGALLEPRFFGVEYLPFEPRAVSPGGVKLEDVDAVARAPGVEHHHVSRLAVAAAAREHPEAHEHGHHQRRREERHRPRSLAVVVGEMAPRPR